MYLPYKTNVAVNTIFFFEFINKEMCLLNVYKLLELGIVFFSWLLRLSPFKKATRTNNHKVWSNDQRL